MVFVCYLCPYLLRQLVICSVFLAVVCLLDTLTPGNFVPDSGY